MASYVLIDSAQRPGFNQRLERLRVPYRSLFEGHPERNLPEIAPLLLPYPHGDGQDESAARHMIDKLAADKPAVSHIQCDLGLAALAAHLRGFHLVGIPGRREMIVRWYDTRVLPAWLEVLDPGQRAAFLTGVASWRYYDRFGDAKDVQLVPGDSTGVDVPRPFVLAESQYAALLKSSEADAVIARLDGIIRDELRRVDPRSLCMFIQAQLQVARSHGLSTTKDFTRFVLMALFTSGRFVEHPYIIARLETGVPDGLPFAEWVETIPEDVFETGAPLWKQSS